LIFIDFLSSVGKYIYFPTDDRNLASLGEKGRRLHAVKYIYFTAHHGR
jgi:hypothetical protein